MLSFSSYTLCLLCFFWNSSMYIFPASQFIYWMSSPVGCSSYHRYCRISQIMIPPSIRAFTLPVFSSYYFQLRLDIFYVHALLLLLRCCIYILLLLFRIFNSKTYEKYGKNLKHIWITYKKVWKAIKGWLGRVDGQQ